VDQFQFNQDTDSRRGWAHKLLFIGITFGVIIVVGIGVFAYTSQLPVDTKGSDVKGGGASTDTGSRDDSDTDTSQSTDETSTEDSSDGNWFSWLFGKHSIAAKVTSSSGLKGSVQYLNVLASLTPSEGASFEPTSLRLKLVSNPRAGSVLSADKRNVTAPGEGTYSALDNGIIRFTPTAQFVGQARGVGFTVTDTAGVTFTSSYIPVVNDVATPPTPPVVTCSDPASEGISLSNSRFFLYSNLETMPLVTDAWSTNTLKGSDTLSSLYVIDDNGNLLRTSEGQSRWSAVPIASNMRVNSYATSNDGNTIFANGQSGDNDAAGYLSTDAGNTWTKRSTLSTDGVIAMSESGQVMITNGTSDPEGGFGVITSIDGGTTWLPAPINAVNVGSVALTPDGTKMFVAAFDPVENDYRIYRSTDSGQTWDSVDPTTDNIGYGRLLTNDAGTELFMDAYSFDDDSSPLYYSSDGGDTWQQVTIPEGMNVDLLQMSLDASRIVMTAHDQDYAVQLYQSTDSGVTWQPITAPGSSFIAAYAGRDGTSITVASSEGIVTSHDGGVTWNAVANIHERFDLTKVDLDPLTPGQQIFIDKTATQGWRLDYDTSTGILTHEVTDTDKYAEHTETSTVQYTLMPKPNCSSPAPGTINLIKADF